MTGKPQGPNVKKLVIRKMSMDAVPLGTPEGEGLAAGIGFLSDPARISASVRASSQWVDLAIQAVRSAPGDNPWRLANDEEIAGHILDEIEKRKKSKK